MGLDISAKITWSELKNLASSKSSNMQYNEKSTIYVIFLIDGGMVFHTNILKDGSSDCVDFETNYKPTSNKKIVDGAVLFGGTDNTKIGNVGNRLKVDADITSIGGAIIESHSSKLRYVDMNAANGGIARDTSVTNAAYSTVYSYTGSGHLHFFVMNLEVKTDWIIKLTVDGEQIFDSTGLLSNDVSASGAYDLDDNSSSLELIGVRWGANTKFVWSSPGGKPIKYNTSISVSITRAPTKPAKKFTGGILCITKVT